VAPVNKSPLSEVGITYPIAVAGLLPEINLVLSKIKP